eukprot:scaffold26523_cov108-Cylindrotheca_fusiformis.AAC.1
MPKPTTTTYYDILEIANDASSLEIKKSYRRLALQHHPDRNKGSAESTEKFKQIGEAYECLSDATKRKEYDTMLKYGTTSTTSPSSASAAYPTTTTSSSPFPRRTRVDPFTQFDDLFRNDPFFQAAFQDLDDEFSKRFQNSDKNNNTGKTKKKTSQSTEGWVPWLLRQCGIQFQMTSYSTVGGKQTATTYSSNDRDTYTAKKSETYIDRQGRRVTVQSMEKNGNQIRDTFINDQLAERRVNGVAENLERIRD